MSSALLVVCALEVLLAGCSGSDGSAEQSAGQVAANNATEPGAESASAELLKGQQEATRIKKTMRLVFSRLRRR